MRSISIFFSSSARWVGRLLIAALLLSCTNTLLAQTANYWTGQTNDQWHVSANWSLTAVPTATHDVVISSTATTQPVLSTTVVANSVEVQNGASLSVTSTGSLTVNGSKLINSNATRFYNSGTVVSGGRLVLGGSGPNESFGLWNLSSFSNVAGVA